MLKDKAAQRVEIAQDVLHQMAAGKITAACGVFIDNALHIKCGSADPETEVQSILQNVGSCEVCAKGALFVATILRHDKYTVRQLFCRELWRTLYTAVQDFFTREQFDLIEVAFEGRCMYYAGGSVSAADAEKAIAFGDQYGQADDRLVAIMQNIIDNQGTFIPWVISRSFAF